MKTKQVDSFSLSSSFLSALSPLISLPPSRFPLKYPAIHFRLSLINTETEVHLSSMEAFFFNSWGL